MMDGITMIREIKQDRTISHIPIIILSAKASVEDQLKGFEQEWMAILQSHSLPHT